MSHGVTCRPVTLGAGNLSHVVRHGAANARAEHVLANAGGNFHFVAYAHEIRDTDGGKSGENVIDRAVRVHVMSTICERCAPSPRRRASPFSRRRVNRVRARSPLP